MNAKELEDLTVVTTTNLLITNARLTALESLLWSYLNVEFEQMEKGYSFVQRKLFFQFCLENVNALKKQLPTVLAESPVAQNELKNAAQELLAQIDLLPGETGYTAHLK